MRKTPFQFLFILMVSSCTTLKPVATPPIFVTGQAMVETLMVTETPMPTAVVATKQEVVIPQLTTICSNDQEVPFAELDLPKDLRLLLLPNTVEGYPPVPGKPLITSTEIPTPMPIINDEVLQYSVSPNHKWIYFARSNTDNKHSVLWISSLDGSIQMPVIDLTSETYTGYASWVSDEEIFIIGSPQESDLSALNLWEYMPFISVNPFTLEQKQLRYLARNAEDGLYYYGSVRQNKNSLGLYGSLNMVDFIYNFETDQAITAFSWLDKVEPFEMQAIKPIWVYDGDKFAVTVARPDGIDLAFNLSMQSSIESKQYNEIMLKIILPERFLPVSMLGIVPEKGILLFQRFDLFNTSQGENWIYALDYNKQTIMDYCFDLRDSVKKVKFSPDSRFVAFSLENFGSELVQDQHYVAVLDLESGHVSYLKGYTLVDWGVVAP